MKKIRLDSAMNAEIISHVASKSIANNNAMADAIVYPAIKIQGNDITCTTKASYNHFVKAIQNGNKYFLRRDEPFSMFLLPFVYDNEWQYISVLTPVPNNTDAVRIVRVKKGLFNLIPLSVYEQRCDTDEGVTIEYIRF